MEHVGYVWEKVYFSVLALCREGTFTERLRNATISHLIRLNDDDLTGELADDLKYILDLSKRNMSDGKIINELDESERKEFIEKLIHIFLETTRIKENM